MDIQQMQTLTNAAQNTITSNNLTGAMTGGGALIGSVVGSVVPGIGTAVGAGVGGAVGGLTGSLLDATIPTYSSVRASVQGLNFVKLNLKPYWIECYVPTVKELEELDKFYKYYGCATHRTEPLNIANYMYQNHAYIKGDLQYNNTIPLDKFEVIKAIFNKGVNILNG